MTSATTPPLLTVEECARHYRQSVVTIRQKIRRGEIAAVRLGERGPLRVPADAVERHLRPVSSLARESGPREPAVGVWSHSPAAGTTTRKERV